LVEARKGGYQPEDPGGEKNLIKVLKGYPLVLQGGRQNNTRRRKGWGKREAWWGGPTLLQRRGGKITIDFYAYLETLIGKHG